MKKIFKFAVILVIIGLLFASCQMPNGDVTPARPWFESDAIKVAYMFGYNLYNDPSAPIEDNNVYKGPNERTGVCLDYAIHFALLTDSFIIVSPPSYNPGIYKIINTTTPTGNRWRPSGNGMIAESFDKTEAWYLEKVGEFSPNLGRISNFPHNEQHAWNLTKDNYSIDISALDTGYGSVRWESYYRKLPN